MLKSTDNFLALVENPSVKYEEGARENALLISPYVTGAINVVEAKQYGSFPDGVIIYLPKDLESFSSYCACKTPRAIVIGGRVFISPILLDEPELIQGILIHELSHLQLSQSLGRWNFHSHVPVWFAEGLAVYVSDGAGAEEVTRSEAIHTIKSGQSIEPNGSGSFFFPKTASNFGLSRHMFYRQSSLYIEWLHNYDQSSFKNLLLRLRKGDTVEKAMQNSCGFGVKEGWNQFVADIKI